MIRIDPERFHELKAHMGVLGARQQCTRESVIHTIESAQTVTDLKEALMEIVKQIRFDK